MAEEDDGKMGSDPVEATTTRSSAKDIDDEIQALVTKAKQRLEGVSKTMEDNGSKLKKLQKGFSDLKRQQAHVAREQQQVIGSLQNGLTTT
mmetsp:Transcript_120157/g.285498  ORF Transcript_120157/g.285498 Transcript_120157/m.285498 type:complete len:91 (-) Transcript_120157:228-500(-)|eukprot:CAMPEP_0181401556 /NCGR_PEP_ID=MMETSP1110-20121109/2709_1 /TAXON_ID=174948 /ORGANISM="Symbiodinium sp., Strain CCMP421" /LENGTH=90 /DNA_ID=CAMNT_0023523725 /DNA_START=55 /DNA_END=327 /DNA_ORIENTATION=+